MLFNWSLQLRSISAWIFALSTPASVGGNELVLDFLYDVDGNAFHCGIGGINLGGAETEGVLDRGESAMLSERMVVAIDQ
jgi:hypothetical protein